MDTACDMGATRGQTTLKRFRLGTERAIDPAQTFERARGLMHQFGITRIATTTHLDRIGIPVVAASRPNSRSLAVSQGKGLTLEAARASALMESIECYHAEHILAPLVLASHGELGREHVLADVRGLPRVTSRSFHADRPLLWIAGVDLLSRRRIFVPYELVHLDFRLPLPSASGAFLMSSNGLASGNQFSEAISHAICELVERDANTLWHISDCVTHDPAHRIDTGSIDDENCRLALNRFEQADVAVAIWDTTTDIGIPSFLCTAVDRDSKMPLRIPPVSGSGCHPRRAIALLRALTEAAQGRVTLISGARDDLSPMAFCEPEVTARADRELERILDVSQTRRFSDVPDIVHDHFEADVDWELRRLTSAGLEQVIVVDLTKVDVGIPVVRVVIPYLEGMSEVPGFIPGPRARHRASELAS